MWPFWVREDEQLPCAPASSQHAVQGDVDWNFSTAEQDTTVAFAFLFYCSDIWITTSWGKAILLVEFVRLLVRLLLNLC